MAADSPTLAEHLIGLETVALHRWCDGDPSGFLEISAPDVVYFDPFIERRIDGLSALSAYYEGLRGKIRAERFELLNPAVQPIGDSGAVLTFNFVSYEGNRSAWWNCTEVYRRTGDRWKIIQTHWSWTKRPN